MTNQFECAEAIFVDQYMNLDPQARSVWIGDAGSIIAQAKSIPVGLLSLTRTIESNIVRSEGREAYNANSIINDGIAIGIMISGNHKLNNFFTRDVLPIETAEDLFELRVHSIANDSIAINQKDVARSLLEVGTQYFFLKESYSQDSSPFLELGDHADKFLDDFGAIAITQLRKITGKQLQQIAENTGMKLGLPIKNVDSMPVSERAEYYNTLRSAFLYDIAFFYNNLRVNYQENSSI